MYIAQTLTFICKQKQKVSETKKKKKRFVCMSKRRKVFFFFFAHGFSVCNLNLLGDLPNPLGSVWETRNTRPKKTLPLGQRHQIDIRELCFTPILYSWFSVSSHNSRSWSKTYFRYGALVVCGKMSVGEKVSEPFVSYYAGIFSKELLFIMSN